MPINNQENALKNWTMDKMRVSLDSAADAVGLSVDWGTEDGFTWITLSGDEVAPKKFDKLARMVADATGRDFYAQSISNGSICGALDAEPAKDKTAEPWHYLARHIKDYGTKFEPKGASKKYRRSTPTPEENAFAKLLAEPSVAASQAKVEELLGKHPELSSARLETLVMEVHDRGGPMERPAPLWWAAVAGADPEGWSSWMNASDSEITDQCLFDQAGQLDDPVRRQKALTDFGVRIRQRKFS